MANILVADDSIFQRDNIRYFLKLDGHTIFEASNGHGVLEILGMHEIDCILLDIIMPQMDGLDVLASLEHRGLNIPVIMLTADIQESTREECLKRGATMVVHKPIKGNKLRELVNQVLDNPKEATW